MAYFLTKIFIAFGLIGLAGLVLAILKSKGKDNETTANNDDKWDEF